MNRGARAAVPLARDLLVHAVQTMTVEDAKAILQEATPRSQRSLNPSRATPSRQSFCLSSPRLRRVDLAAKYNALANRGVELGLIKPADAYRATRH